jgi:putative flippase GtrA
MRIAAKESRRKRMSAIAQPITVQRSKASQRRGYDYWAPTAKVSAGVLAGAATILITAFLSPHWKNWTQQDMTPAIVTAITTIVTFAIQYWVPERRK